MFERAEIDFTCHAEIGPEGRNSKVFLATDHQLDAEIVVKRINREDFADEAEFFSEAKRLYDARHAHVVPVKFACKTDDFVFIAMPHYVQGSVHSLLRRRHLTVRDIVRIGLDFLTGLHHIHLRRLIHFDVKPSNILIDASGKAAITDFGLAKYVDDHGVAERERMYHAHRPPEGYLYDVYGQGADIYQAGLTLYRMAVGLDSFDDQWARFGDNWNEAAKAVLAGGLPDRTSLAYPAHIPGRLRNTIRRALEPDPDDRYRETLGLINDLGGVDEWLDWQYQRTAALESWTCRTLTHQKVIELREESRRSFQVRAKTIRSEDGRERRSNTFSGDTDTRAKAHRLVREALSHL